MKLHRILYTLCTGCIFAMFLSSCNNEPFDYSRLNISRMDLSGAKSLSLIKDISSRAIDGEFLRAGLYKVDADGNMTAVAVYFTQDKDGGNYTESSHTLTINPHKLYDITENFMIAFDCSYYDKDGDYVYVPYHVLLIRKSDGRIWDISAQTTGNHFGNGPIYIDQIDPPYPYELKKKFTQSNKGELYYAKQYVYKFNLNTNNPSLEQITKASYFYEDVHIQDNDAIWSADSHYIDISWPYSGYQSLSHNDLIEMEFGTTSIDATQLGLGFDKIKTMTISSIYNVHTFSMNENPVVIFNPYIEYNQGVYVSPDEKEKFKQFCQEYIKPVRADFLEIGSVYGDIKMSGNPIILQDAPSDFISAVKSSDYVGYEIKDCYPTDNYILVTDNSEKTWLTLIDLNKREWRWIRQLDYAFGAGGATIKYNGNYNTSIEYSNKIYFIDNRYDHFGCYWLDLKSFEDGFIPFDFSLPDFMKNYKDVYSIEYIFDGNGHFTADWKSPTDGNNYYLTIGIPSGHGEITMEEPDMYFDTIIPLN